MYKRQVPTLTREVSTFAYAKRPGFFDDPFFQRFADSREVTRVSNPDFRRQMAESPAAERYRTALGQAQANLQVLAEAGPQVRPTSDGMISPQLRALLSTDDVMQQAYTDAFLSIQDFTYAGSESFTRWLTTLARRNGVDAIRALRAAKRGGRHERVQTHEESVASLLDIVTGVSATPSRFVAGNEARSALEAAIHQLPDVYAKVVRRLDLEGADVSDVASELNRSQGAVYMLRARAHDRLKGILGSASQFWSDGA